MKVTPTFEVVVKDIKTHNSLGMPVTETRYNMKYADEICQFQTDLEPEAFLAIAKSYVNKTSSELKDFAIANLKALEPKRQYSAFALKAEMTKVQSMAGIATRLYQLENVTSTADLDKMYIIHKTYKGNTNTIALSGVDMATSFLGAPILDDVEVEEAI